MSTHLRRAAAATLTAAALGMMGLAYSAPAGAAALTVDPTVIADPADPSTASLVPGIPVPTQPQVAAAVIDTMPALVLASGDAGHTVDALAAGPFAGLIAAPILLTPSTGGVDPAVVRYLSARETSDSPVATVYIVGGAAAVPARVAEQLTAEGYVVVRLGGATRYETARLVAAAHDTALRELGEAVS